MEIDFSGVTIFDSKKEMFLSNARYKQRFVTSLSEKYRLNGISTINCKADADVEIVNLLRRSCYLLSAEEEYVTISADDTDILALLLH